MVRVFWFAYFYNNDINMKNKSKINLKRTKLFQNKDWDWLFVHSCLLIIFAQQAFLHKSLVAFVLIGLFALVFISHDLSIINKWGLYTKPPNPRYLKSYMLYMAVQLLFTLMLGLFGRLWNASFLLIIFIFCVIFIVPIAIKTLLSTSYIIKRWARFWPRTM